MDNSVAVFVDGTPGCEAALHYAVRLASNRHGKIVLATTSKAFNDSMVEAESYLDRMAMRLRHEDIVIQRHISICTASSNDDLVPSIQAAVALYRSSAIVTSAKLANASSAHLIKLTHIPIIHVHSKVESSSRPRIATKPILVPLDKSEFSEQALPFAIDMARSANVPLVLLHVVPSLRNALYTNALAAGQPWSFLADETLEAEEAVIVQDAHRPLILQRHL